jgi:hypothetical protein
MKKKKRFFCGLLVIIAGVVIWYCLRKPSGRVTVQPTSIETNQASSKPAPIRNGQASAGSATTSKPTPESNPAAWTEMRLKQMEEERQKGLNEWRTSIEFYGKVIDENTNPVEGAQVDFGCNDLSPAGTSFYHTQSDGNGLFSIRGINGKLLSVKVTKQGYYAYQPFGASFYYAGQNQNFVPDAAHPVIFRLKKKGVAEPLVHIQAPMGGPKGYRIARDGTALEISLMTGDAAAPGQGDLRVQGQTDDKGKPAGQKYDWKCQISVPNGGLVQSTDDLNFEAPTDGYRSLDVINMPATLGVDWSDHAHRAYFLKLANGNYARISFDMVAGGDHFFQLESFLNPSGSRNLEFDPAQEIKP